MDTIELKINGMTCGSCVTSVTRALQRVPGVGAVEVDLARGTARVSGDAQATPAMLAALEAAGYEAAPLGGNAEAANAHARHGGGCGSAGGAHKCGGCCH
ncbi:heavy-metal-associated domain-containing protein [Cupriavidus pinatubonensis]|jgi:copper chaperone CopZ|uniref:HMA domain-containing protein n=1 Tax=Cupriavidus pinatubonensis TaxID=248026 RepID=A0ABM8XUL5_9BURK|nr:heavy metal-associated domain-containing protein [Cupriavidus pinatubonensis]CAG9184028.1 hypothetical protein LMG23994_05291 [Cupriavidus pinatubonensis]